MMILIFLLHCFTALYRFFLLLLRDPLRLWVSNFSNQFHTCTVGYVNFLDSRCCCCQKMRWRVKITDKKIHTNRTGPAANADCERARTAEIYNIWRNRSKLDINTANIAASDLTVAGFIFAESLTASPPHRCSKSKSSDLAKVRSKKCAQQPSTTSPK